MEYSVASNSTSISHTYGVPFPHLTSQPANDLVNPGLGQIVNLFDMIVPMKGKSIHTVEKKAEKPDELKEEKIESKDQIGSGKLTSEIAESFQKPIVTDSIVFPKDEKNSKKRKELNVPSSSVKKAKISHKFYIV